MISLELFIRKARSDFYSDVPETKRVCDAAYEYMLPVLQPFIQSDSKEVRDTAGLIYDRFVHGITDDAAPIERTRNPAITEVRS